MKKYYPDCRYYHMEFWYPNRCPHVGAEKICDNFEWADERLAAGELAMSILMMLANDEYYPMSVKTIPRRALALDMTGEYERCLDELEEGEA